MSDTYPLSQTAEEVQSALDAAGNPATSAQSGNGTANVFWQAIGY